jgi:hypothetical protein
MAEEQARNSYTILKLLCMVFVQLKLARQQAAGCLLKNSLKWHKKVPAGRRC